MHLEALIAAKELIRKRLCFFERTSWLGMQSDMILFPICKTC